MNGQDFYPSVANLKLTSGSNLQINISGGEVKIHHIHNGLDIIASSSMLDELETELSTKYNKDLLINDVVQRQY